MIRGSLVALGLSGILASGIRAQVDSTRRDTTAAGGAAGAAAVDTTKKDTVAALLPAFPLAIAVGPLPRGARYTFNTDSLLLTGARTLSDLLTHVPGVYVARGGWYGQAEPVLYAGRGPASLEVFWDGVPYLPLGRDSVWLDPARIPLAPLERIDVLMLPGRLQVYLVTARPRSTSPLTQVGVLTGVADIAGYRAGYATRTRSGFGVAVIADWNSMGNGPSGTTTPFGTSDLSFKMDYVPAGGRVGASFQVMSSSWHRASSDDGRVEGWRQDRRDRYLRFFVAQREDGLGFRFTGTLASSAVSHDTSLAGPRAISSANVEVSRTWPRATVAAIGQFGAGGAPQRTEVRGGWQPIPMLTLAGDAWHTSYAGDRAGNGASVTAGLTLPLGFSARVQAMHVRDVQSAFVTSDPTQAITDQAWWVRFDHRRLTVEVGRSKLGTFVPLGFARGISTVDSLRPGLVADYLAAHATLQVAPGLQLSGWYWDPVSGGTDFEPPHHARVSATFNSKFWRVFKSGIFRLRAEVAMESWSRSPYGGLDSAGTRARAMNGASFVDTNLDMQLAGVTIFWTLQNVNIMRSSYVEGLGFPKSVQQYGARWFFNN